MRCNNDDADSFNLWLSRVVSRGPASSDRGPSWCWRTAVRCCKKPPLTTPCLFYSPGPEAAGQTKRYKKGGGETRLHIRGTPNWVTPCGMECRLIGYITDQRHYRDIVKVIA
ncbi:hypothetical protein NDU88_002993 [Pleurodeles waltl]|uniref:Uncharacterized protein n=1 Tax=Pleurodeles waltl TaxID=8319 RepID=A0AAV7SED1_PLEWA|nr:hypothetical protein NDU88_002993 [Pleurodeles waltl]